MNPKHIFYEKFNETCDEFCKDIIASFPNIEAFKHIKVGLNIIKNLDMKSPQRVFHNHIYITQYKDMILMRNEDFFLTKDDFNLRHSSVEKKEYWSDFINSIRNIWRNLPGTDKDIIWKYFHILLILSEKCSVDH